MILPALSLVLAGACAAALAIKRAAITDFNGQSPLAWAYPPGRGFAAENSTTAPCGGFSPGNRTTYPLSNGDIAFTQQTELDNIVFLYTNESDPVRFHSFSTYTNTLADLGAGHYCSKAPDFAELGFQAGDDATLLVIFQLEGASTYYYQCADITLVADTAYTAPSDEYVCGNYTSTLKEESADESMHLGAASNSTGSTGGSSNSTGHAASTTAATAGEAESSAASGQSNDQASSATGESDGLSAAAGGGIGAAVTIVVLALVAATAYFFGWLSFGKKRARGTTGDDASSNSDAPNVKQPHH